MLKEHFFQRLSMLFIKNTIYKEMIWNRYFQKFLNHGVYNYEKNNSIILKFSITNIFKSILFSLTRDILPFYLQKWCLKIPLDVLKEYFIIQVKFGPSETRIFYLKGSLRREFLEIHALGGLNEVHCFFHIFPNTLKPGEIYLVLTWVTQTSACNAGYKTDSRML